MKPLVIIILALLIGSISPISADIHYTHSEYDLGVINECDGLVTTTFELINDTNESVIITDIHKSCGCTTVDYNRAQIPAGESREIKVTYNPSGEIGNFHRSIIVSTSANGDKQRLSITGRVTPTQACLDNKYPIQINNLRLSNSTILFGEIAEHSCSSSFLLAYNHGDKPIELTFSDLPQYITLPDKITLNAGEKGTIIATFDASKLNDLGAIHDSLSIKIKSTDGDSTTTKVATAAMIMEDFSKLTQQQLIEAPIIHVSAERLHFTQLELRADIIDSQKLIITNRGVRDLIIHKIYSPYSYINSRIINNFVKAGESVEVTIYVTPSYIEPMVDILNEKITIISNDPTNPMKDIQIVGEITPINNTEHGTCRE